MRRGKETAFLNRKKGGIFVNMPLEKGAIAADLREAPQKEVTKR